MLSVAKSSQKKNPKKRVFSFLKRDFPGWLLLIPAIILFYYTVWRPIAVSIGLSFFSLRGFDPVNFVGLKNYVDVITDTDFLKILWNSFSYVAWSLIIGFPLPFIVAVLLNELVVTKNVLKISVYIPSIIPGIATYMIWGFFLAPDNTGVLNILLSFFGIGQVEWLQNTALTIPMLVVASTWHGFGATAIIYLASLQGINKELYEAVRIDGGGAWRRFTTVLMPHMKNMLLLMGVRQIITVFQIMEMPLVMTGGGPNGASNTLALQSYRYAFEFGQLDKGITLGVITFVILVIMTLGYVWLDKKLSED